MSNPSPTLEQFWSDGLWFVHEVTRDRRAKVYRLEVEDFDRSAFLDRRITIGKRQRGLRVSFDRLAEGAPPNAPSRTNYICHHSHIGSTLLSKIIGLAPGVASLREPVILRWLASQDYLAMTGRSAPLDQDRRANDLKVCLGLLGRPVNGRETIVVKATSFANQVIVDALDVQPEARVVALFGKPEDFIAGVLSKESGREDLTGNAEFRARRLEALVGEGRWDQEELAPGELAAMSWLTEMATMAQMRKVAASRFRWFDFNALLADMDGVLPEVAWHFDIAWGEDEFRLLHESGLLGRHAKRGDATFDAAERDARMAQARHDHAEDISRGMRWLDDVRACHPHLLPEPLE